MSRIFFRLASGHNSRRSLSAQGQRLKMFAGMVSCIALALFVVGGYLIAQQFLNPLQPQSLDLPLAALLITTALTLLLCLLHRSRSLPTEIIDVPASVYWEEKKVAIVTSDARMQEITNRAVPGRYVDRARIRIQR